MVFKEFKEKYEYKAVDHFPTQVKSKPMVSVCVVTYNHVNYIKQCLDRILNQKVDFNFEILLGDDASTDGTREICIAYAEKYPDKIRLFLHHRENNIKIGGQPTGRFNFLYNLYSAQGKYIAVCEGDDFWTHSNKMKMQVDFLEKNQEYEMCFTNTRIIDNIGNVKNKKLIKKNNKTTYLHKDMPIWAPALTRVFKNRISENLNINVPGLDTFMLVYLSTLGKIKYLNEITGAYRHHKGGVFSLLSRAKRHEHNIETRLACLEIVENIYIKKYLGVILKELIDLKKLDFELFKKMNNSISKEIGKIKKAPRDKYFLFMLYLYLARLPYLYKFPFFRKSINRVLIY